MREDLEMPFGRLVDEGTAVEELRAGPLSVCVGDVVSLAVLEGGLQPDLMVYDLRSERRPMDGLKSKLPGLEGNQARVENPAGRITPELVRAIRKALASSAKTMIKVEGEEDLASLVVAALAPDGTRLVYGLPGRGIVSVKVDDGVRRTAIGLIHRMEECV
jgi:uncharacterized protein (UPF0218 family)